jgi:oligosaccharide repeat unit polymerase
MEDLLRFPFANMKATHTWYLCVAVLLCVAAPNRFSTSFVSLCLAVSITEAVLHILLIARNAKGRAVNWLRADVALMAGYFIIHFGFVTYGLAGLLHPRWRAIDTIDSVSLATAAATAGLAAFLLGYSLTPRGIRQYRMSEANLNRVGLGWEAVGYILALLSLGVAAWAAYKHRAVFLVGAYKGFEGISVADGAIIWGGRMLLTAGTVLIVTGRLYANRRSMLSPLLVAFVLPQLLMQLIYGARSELIYYFAPAAIAYAENRKPIKFFHLLIGILAMMSVFGIIGLARQASQRGLGAVVSVGSEKWRDSIDVAFRNFSQSGLVYYTAVDHIQEKQDFYYGQMQVGGLLSFIPFAKTMLGVKAEDCISDHLLTRIILGPNSRSGTGTTIVADLYLDLGVSAVILGMLLLGYFARYVYEQAHADKANAFWVVANACTIAGCGVVARYSVLALVVRRVIYVGALAWMATRYATGDTTRRRLADCTALPLKRRHTSSDNII